MTHAAAGRMRAGAGRWLPLGVAALILMATLAPMAGPASAEMFLDLYTGKSFTLNSDIRISQPSLGNRFTVEDVGFDDASFEGAPYYGLRLGYFFETYPWLGTAIEYFHFKMFAETSSSKRLVGTLAGSTVDTSARVDSVIQVFQVTHGVNYLTADALLRYQLFKDPERFPQGRAQLYGGVGIGPVITHAETIVADMQGPEKYDVSGVGVQGFVGIRAMLFKHVGLFAEYKFTHSSLDVGIAQGRGRVEENTHHAVGGITITLPSF